MTNVAELDAVELDELVAAASRGRVCARVELVGERPRIKNGLLAGFVVAALSGCASAPEQSNLHEHAIEPDVAGAGSWIGGIVRDQDDQGVANTLVLLESDALPAALECWTNERGVFAFSQLPPGWYTIHVFGERGKPSRVIQLPVDVRFRVDFRVNTAPVIMGIVFERPDPMSPSSTMLIE